MADGTCSQCKQIIKCTSRQRSEQAGVSVVNVSDFFVVKHADGHGFASNPSVHESRTCNHLPEGVDHQENGDDDGNRSTCSIRTFDYRSSEAWTGKQFMAHVTGDSAWRNADIRADDTAGTNDAANNDGWFDETQQGGHWFDESGARCYHCDEWGHSMRSCPSITCPWCNHKGHI